MLIYITYGEPFQVFRTHAMTQKSKMHSNTFSTKAPRSWDGITSAGQMNKINKNQSVVSVNNNRLKRLLCVRYNYKKVFKVKRRQKRVRPKSWITIKRHKITKQTEEVHSLKLLAIQRNVQFFY